MEELKVYALSAIERVPHIVLWTLLALLVGGIIWSLCRNGLREGLRVSAALLLIEWTFLIMGMAVLFRETTPGSVIRLIPFSSYFQIPENSYLLEIVAINLLNVALFIPIGLLLGCVFQNINWRQVFVVGLCLSVLIELLQLVFKKGLCEIDDVIHNVVGCLVGYGLYQIAAVITKRSSINKDV